ncbi:hypothetical protein DFS13_107224 [Burkholderia sp. 28_3]|nr:hypothetical protein A8E76_35905 [Burkholderia cenocepacia]PZX01517.1 hypothetical protein DFS13_107224 [Burkholderia sp. 28_3]RAS51852.1 hypothetical protein DFS07_111103 [Burkholderia cenocepacia]
MMKTQRDGISEKLLTLGMPTRSITWQTCLILLMQRLILLVKCFNVLRIKVTRMPRTILG